MSATRDKSQRFTFVFNNLYNVYLKTKPGVSIDKPVFKPSDLEFARASTDSLATPVRPSPVAPAGAPTESPAESKSPKGDSAGKPSITLMNLKRDLNQLKEIQGKMRFLLQELEEIMKDE